MTGDAPGARTIQLAEFPSTGTGVDKARDPISASSNPSTQPWKFPMIADELLPMADRCQTLPVVDPLVRVRVISCAAGAFKLRLGGGVEITIFPKVGGADHVTRVSFPSGERVSRKHDELFVSLIAPATSRTSQTRERVLPRAGESRYQAPCSDQVAETGVAPPRQLMVRLGRGPIVPQASRRALEDALS